MWTVCRVPVGAGGGEGVQTEGVCAALVALQLWAGAARLVTRPDAGRPGRPGGPPPGPRPGPGGGYRGHRGVT